MAESTLQDMLSMPFYVRQRQTDEDPAKEQLFRGVFTVVVNHHWHIVFVPEYSPIEESELTDLPVNLDDVSTVAQAHSYSRLFSLFSVSLSRGGPSYELLSIPERFHSPSYGTQHSVFLVAPQDYSDFEASLAMLSERHPFFDSTVTLGQYSHLPVVKFITDRMLGISNRLIN